MRNIEVKDLGIIEYKKAWDYQEKIFNEQINNKVSNRKTKNYLILCEHPHVYTLGKSGKTHNLLINNTQLKEKNVSFYKTNRGGDITYHGPGQVVGYPIINLTEYSIGLKEYIDYLESIIITTIEKFNIKGERLEGSTGVWLDTKIANKTRKICAIGVKSSRFITMHGFALNVNTDLSYYNYINPCGFTDKSVTSIQKELDQSVNIEELKTKLIAEFLNKFN
ncbi:lipoyl(octanoyl) transferase LipB [Bacteroidota bacterium]